MQIVEERRETYLISTDPTRLDVDAIHTALATLYWSEGIPREIVEQSLSGSIAFGVYHVSQQVGLARVVTDGATFAWLSDVYILEEHRGHGIGHWLMEVVMRHSALQKIRRFSLVTRDAHALYADFGFRPLADPSRHMEIVRPGLYRRSPGGLPSELAPRVESSIGSKIRRMPDFIELHLVGSGQLVAINPEHVVQLQEFDSGRGGPGTTLKLVSGESVNVQGRVTDLMTLLQNRK